jgi:hypothetical protein
MFGWVTRMLRRRSGTPTDERSIQSERLDRAEAEVHAQTAQVRRIRLEAQAAQQRIDRR